MTPVDFLFVFPLIGFQALIQPFGHVQCPLGKTVHRSPRIRQNASLHVNRTCVTFGVPWRRFSIFNGQSNALPFFCLSWSITSWWNWPCYSGIISSCQEEVTWAPLSCLPQHLIHTLQVRPDQWHTTTRERWPDLSSHSLWWFQSNFMVTT